MKNKERIYKLSFASVYPYYVEKAEKKGRSKAEVDDIIRWLTGYSEKDLQNILASDMNFETFFTQAPQINPNASKITGGNLRVSGGRDRRRNCAKSTLFGQAD